MPALVGNEVVYALAMSSTGNPTAAYENAIIGKFGSAAHITPGSCFGLSGMLSKQISGSAINPGATGADNVLAVFSLPANAFDAAGRRLVIAAYGSVANNTNTKEIKIIFNPSTAVVGSTVGTGGTTLADTGSYSTTGATSWSVSAMVMKYGAANSNTQLGFNAKAVIGATSVTSPVPTALTATENAAILVAITGNAGTTATDISLYVMICEGWD